MVARHRAIDLLRKLRRVEITADATLDALREDRRVDDSFRAPPEVADLVGLLPPAHQHTLALRYVYAFSTREIAETIGKSEAAVRQIESRVLGHLRHELAAAAEAA